MEQEVLGVFAWSGRKVFYECYDVMIEICWKAFHSLCQEKFSAGAFVC